ncbi:hypothetical protein CHELA1G11_70033 [Hyphomicrobiales bacterium]|nr:hypothetical protein CHELA1G2_60019 [Hyphomicrobiales bacterium]CAH1696927.1 hypothetical protein CHELA1G11_70033 [Hyphomicrobiales bacterium]
MCLGSSGSKSQVSTNFLDPSVAAAYNDVMGRARDVINQGYTPYQGELVAPLNNNQQWGIQGLGQLKGISDPYFATGQQQLNGAATAAQYAGVPLQYAQTNLSNASTYGGNAGVYGAQAGQYGNAAAGLVGKATGYGDQAAQYVNQGVGYANTAANVGNQALGYGQQAANLVNQGAGYGSQAANYVSQGNQYAGQAANIASGALGYGSRAADMADQGAQYGAQGAGYISQGSQYGQQAADYANQLGQTKITPMAFSAQALQQYLDPGQQALVDATMNTLQRQNAAQQTALMGNAIAKGAWGGDRAGVAQAELMGQQGLVNAQTLAQLNSQNYTQALNMFNQQQGVDLQGQLANAQNLGQASGLLSNIGSLYGQFGNSMFDAGNLQNALAGTMLGAGNLQNSVANTYAGLGSLSNQFGNTMLGAGSLYNSLAGSMNNTGALANSVAGMYSGLGGLSNQFAGTLNQTGALNNSLANTMLGGGELALGQGNLALGQGQLENSIAGQQANLANAAAQNAQLQAQIAGQYGSMGTAAQDAAMQAYLAQIQGGNIQQANHQDWIDSQVAQWTAQQQHPYEAVGWYGNLATGIGAQTPGTSVTRGSADGGRISGYADGGHVMHPSVTRALAIADRHRPGYALGGITRRDDDKRPLGTTPLSIVSGSQISARPFQAPAAPDLISKLAQEEKQQQEMAGKVLQAGMPMIKNVGSKALGWLTGAPGAGAAAGAAGATAPLSIAPAAQIAGVGALAPTAVAAPSIGMGAAGAAPIAGLAGAGAGAAGAAGAGAAAAAAPGAAAGLGATLGSLATGAGEVLATILPFLAFSDERMKEDIEPIGETYDGQPLYRYRFKGDPKTEIGLLAQDVEKTNPDAVYDINGAKMVDYGHATENAAERGHYASGGVVDGILGGLLSKGLAGSVGGDGSAMALGPDKFGLLGALGGFNAGGIVPPGSPGLGGMPGMAGLGAFGSAPPFAMGGPVPRNGVAQALLDIEPAIRSVKSRNRPHLLAGVPDISRAKPFKKGRRFADGGSVDDEQIDLPAPPPVLAAPPQAASAPRPTGGDPAADAVGFFVRQGYSPSQAAGFVGNLMAESSRGLNPRAVGDSGSAYGLAQWRDNRRSDLMDFAKSRGLDPSARDTQLRYANMELQTSEAPAAARLRSANTTEQAAQAATDFFRPQGWKRGDSSGALHLDRRVQNALDVAKRVGAGAGGSPTAVADLPMAGAAEASLSGQGDLGAQKGLFGLDPTTSDAIMSLANGVLTGLMLGNKKNPAAGIGAAGLAGLQTFQGLQNSRNSSTEKAMKLAMDIRKQREDADFRNRQLGLTEQQLGQSAAQHADEMRYRRETSGKPDYTMVGGRGKDANGDVVDGAYVFDKNSGKTEFRPDVAVTKAPPRMLPQSTIGRFNQVGENLTNWDGLKDKFNDNYAGYGSAGVGNMANWIARQTGLGNTNAATWWQDYQLQANKTRNELFGSALTATEKGEWDKAAINPGMHPDMIRANIGIQQRIARNAVKRMAEPYLKQGYDPDVIESAIGVPLSDIGATGKGGKGFTKKNSDGDPSAAAREAARAAIQAGAPRDAVIQRLRENGVDTEGL